MAEMVMASNMAPTLIEDAGARFSKTARSHPAHREARRGVGRLRAAAVLRGRLADDAAERAAERAEAREADVEADLGDAAVGLAQQEHRALDAAALQVAVWRLAEGRAERPDEVRLRDVGDACEARHVERLGIGAVHRVAGAQHPAVGVLDGAAHADITLRSAAGE